MKNILLTFAADRTDIIQFFKQSMKNNEKVYACDCLFNYSLTQADGYLITPHASDNSYFSTLTNYCEKNNISVIIPLSDNDLSTLAIHKNALQNLGITAIVSDESVIDICVDRWKTHLFFEYLSIKHPKTFINVEDVKQNIKTGTLSFPLIVKPRFVFEKANSIDVNSIEELDLFYRKMKQKIIFSSNYQKENNETIIIQEDIQGEKYGLLILNDLQGNYITASSLKKLSVDKGETLLANIENINSFEQIIKQLSSELKHVANLEINCYIQESGEVIISELYARIGPNYAFWHVAGISFPKQVIDWLNGLSVSSSNISPIIGTKGSREKVLPVLFNY